MPLPTSVTGLTAANHRSHHEDIHETINILTGDTDGTIQLGTVLGLDSRPKQLQISTEYAADDATETKFGLLIEAYAKGTSPAGTTSAYFGSSTVIKDDLSVDDWAVTGAANNGSGLIRLTVTGHGVETGDSVGVYGVVGATQANGQWIVTKINANTVDLQGSTFSSAYVSGGTLTNRGAYYGALFGIAPSVERTGLTGTALHGDDVNGVGIFNGGTVAATAGYLVNHNSAFGSDPEYYSALQIEANADVGLKMVADYQWGIDLYGDGTATYSDGPIRLPNNGTVYGRNNANNANLPLFRVSTTDEFQLLSTTRLGANVLITDGVNIDIGTSSGTKIGLSTSQKIGFYNATPVAKQTGVAVTAAGVHAALVSLGLIAA